MQHTTLTPMPHDQSLLQALSEPQQSLIRKLRSGATLHHDLATGLFRLHDGTLRRSIHPATVQSLLMAGVIVKGMGGNCSLA